MTTRTYVVCKSIIIKSYKRTISRKHSIADGKPSITQCKIAACKKCRIFYGFHLEFNWSRSSQYNILFMVYLFWFGLCFSFCFGFYFFLVSSYFAFEHISLATYLMIRFACVFRSRNTFTQWMFCLKLKFNENIMMMMMMSQLKNLYVLLDLQNER